MTSNSIDVKHLTFKYDVNQEHNTLDDLSFHVKRGEWLSIIGHNGSGKSTTVRLLDGLLAAESGQIFIEGDLLTEDNVWDIRHKIGMVFQNPDNQFVGATVEDDVAFGLENKGIPLDEMKERVAKALDLVGMSEFADREPSRLSGGQKQRVAIAGALAMQPDIIILDEATSMLDPEGRLELIKTIREIRKQYQMTVVSITHDLDEVALSDRVLVMKKGKVESSSTPEELFNRGDDLLTLGLDVPFSTNLISALKDKGFDFTQNYLTEKDLEDQLWELLLKM
ncbi:MAG: energy-coupling factor transporter ATPase [Leuconostoc sp.]|nr:energy-coupling factor transporter ATPase [Leuconostoc sp.]